MSLRSDIVSLCFWGYRGDLRIELQAPVSQVCPVTLKCVKDSFSRKGLLFT